MTKKIMQLSAVILLIGIQFIQAQSLSKKDIQKIEEEIDYIFQDMIKLAENLDYDELNKGVDDSKQAGFIVNGNYYANFDSLMKVMNIGLKGLEGQVISVAKQKITVLAKDIALVTAYGEANINLTDRDPIIRKFFWTFVYMKINDTWLVVQSHQSN